MTEAALFVYNANSIRHEKGGAMPLEVTRPQGKLVQRSYRTPVGIVVDFGIQIADTVYEPRASAVSPLGVSEAKRGWREVTAQERENYRDWEKKTGSFGNRARKIADIEKRWDEIIAKGKTAQEHQVEQLASYESYMKRRAEAERQYSLKSSNLIAGMALEEIATGNRYIITEITDEGWVYARPENEPTQSGGSIGKGEVKGYRLAVTKEAIPKAEAGRAGKPSPSLFESYNTQYSLKQLREMAKSAGLGPSGLKQDLMNRLIQRGVLK